MNDKNNYPLNELHVWAENKPVMDYNNQRLQDILMPLHVLQAVEQYPKNVPRNEIKNKHYVKELKHNGLLMRCISCYLTVCGFRFLDQSGECACPRCN